MGSRENRRNTNRGNSDNIFWPASKGREALPITNLRSRGTRKRAEARCGLEFAPNFTFILISFRIPAMFSHLLSATLVISKPALLCFSPLSLHLCSTVLIFFPFLLITSFPFPSLPLFFSNSIYSCLTFSLFLIT